MQFVWPFNSIKSQHNNKRKFTPSPSIADKSFKYNYKFDLNRNNGSNYTEMMDFICSLPPIIQLLIITILLICSLLLYEANINKTNLFIFIILRSIAFMGVVIDVYLFLRLIPLGNKDENNKSINLFDQMYKPYHTQSYENIISNINIPKKCNSAPPILNTLCPRMYKPINKLYSPSPSHSPLITITEENRTNSLETAESIMPISENTNIIRPQPSPLHIQQKNISEPIAIPSQSNQESDKREYTPIVIPFPTHKQNIYNPKEEKSVSIVSNKDNTNNICNQRIKLIRDISTSISSHSSDDDILDNYNMNTTYGYGFNINRNYNNTQYNRSINLRSNRIQLSPSALHCNDIITITNNKLKPESIIKPKITPRKTTNKQRQKVMLRNRKEKEKLFNKQQKKIKRTKVKTYNKKPVKRTRIDLENQTKLNIVNHYLKHKKRNRNYNAKKCKLYFNNKNVNCGGHKNVTIWSREIKQIKANTKRFGKRKRRNRERKSWFNGMEERLNVLINEEEERVNGKVSNKWIQEKAMELNKKMYPNSDFKASDGWLRNFKQRFN